MGSIFHLLIIIPNINPQEGLGGEGYQCSSLQYQTVHPTYPGICSGAEIMVEKKRLDSYYNIKHGKDIWMTSRKIHHCSQTQ